MELLTAFTAVAPLRALGALAHFIRHRGKDDHDRVIDAAHRGDLVAFYRYKDRLERDMVRRASARS